MQLCYKTVNKRKSQNVCETLTIIEFQNGNIVLLQTQLPLQTITL